MTPDLLPLAPRARVLAGLLGLGLSLALLFWGLAGRNHELAAVQPGADRVAQAPTSAESVSLAVPALHRTPAGALDSGAAARKGETSRTVEERGAPEGTEVWDLVAELEVLAADAGSFHREALPVIERLTRACKKQDALDTLRGSDSRPSVASQLLERVVADGQRADLVRGAVLLSIATLLSPAEFDRTFVAWFDGGEASPELLRSAGVAAALRGEDPQCAASLDLGFLGGLQTAMDETLPHIYPLRLQRMVGAQQSEVLRSWFRATQATRELFVLAAEAESPEEAGQLQDYMTTYELLFALRGHRALVDPELEDLLLERVGAIAAIGVPGEPSAREPAEQPNMIDFRVAVFLVHSLSICSDAMFDSAIAMSESDHPLLSALADSMQGLVSGGFSVALMQDLERMRYSDRASDRSELFLSLWDAAESLAAMENPADQERSAAYVSGFVLDPSVDGKARAAGISGIAKANQWDVFARTARSVLLADAGKDVQNSAMHFLSTWPKKDPSKIGPVLDILEDAAHNSLSEQVRASCAEHLESLRD